MHVLADQIGSLGLATATDYLLYRYAKGTMAMYPLVNAHTQMQMIPSRALLSPPLSTAFLLLPWQQLQQQQA